MAFSFSSMLKGSPEKVVSDGGEVDYKSMSMGDKLQMLGAALQGDQEALARIPRELQARAQDASKRAAMAELKGLFGNNAPPMTGSPVTEPAPRPEPMPPVVDPTAEAASGVASRLGDQGGLSGVPMTSDRSLSFTPPDLSSVPMKTPVSRQGPLTMRDAIPRLAAAAQAGVNISPFIEMIKGSQPDVDFVNGLGVDKRDSGNVGKFIPSLDKGQEPLFDARGNVVGVRNMDGSIQAAADMAGAVTRAQEAGKADFDLVGVPLKDGSTVQMPRSQAVRALGSNSSAGGAPASSLPAGLGRSQSPAEKVAAEARAKNQADVEALTPKAMSTLRTLDRKTSFILEKLREARTKVKGGAGGSTGLNAWVSGIPNTAAYDLGAVLDTIEANVGFDELAQMRENSPTGGAVGNLTERELALLSSLRGSLKQGQSDEQLVSNIDRMIRELETVNGERQTAFERQFGAGRQPGGARANGAATSSRITPEQARAELARRRAARGGQ